MLNASDLSMLSLKLEMDPKSSSAVSRLGSVVIRLVTKIKRSSAYADTFCGDKVGV